MATFRDVKKMCEENRMRLSPERDPIAYNLNNAIDCLAEALEMDLNGIKNRLDQIVSIAQHLAQK